jgi:hypothetical protein
MKKIYEMVGNRRKEMKIDESRERSPQGTKGKSVRKNDGLDRGSIMGIVGIVGMWI